MDLNAVLSHHLLDHTYFTLFTIGGITFSITKHLVMMWIVGALLVTTLGYAAHGKSQAALLLRTGVEAVVIYLRDTVVMPLLGHDGKKYLHYFLTLFFFILTCNLIGLIPGSATATGNVGVTAGLALCTLGFIIIGGIRAQGVIAFIKHFAPVPPGLPIIMVPFLTAILFVIEVLGLFVKCFALTIRLFANMIAGHIVALGFMSLIFIFGAVSQTIGIFVAGPFALALVTFINCLEILVALLQAFIFTLLTAVFVGSVMHAH